MCARIAFSAATGWRRRTARWMSRCWRRISPPSTRGEIVSWPAERVSRTIADGTRTQSIGALNFAHLSRLLDAVVTVSEVEIAAAVRLAAEEARLVVEPSGALPVAAIRFRAREAGLVGLDGPVVGVVSGGNVDPDRYVAYLESPIPPEG